MRRDQVDPLFAELTQCRAERGRVFRSSSGAVCLFDAEAARRANRKNFATMAMPNRFVDTLRGRTSPTIDWEDIRSGWATKLRELDTPTGLSRLSGLMEQYVRLFAVGTVDIAHVVQEVSCRAILDGIVRGLESDDVATIMSDLWLKMDRLFLRQPEKASLMLHARRVVAQIRAGRVVRRELLGRSSGRRARQVDLADVLVDRLHDLGIDRASYAVATAITAIGGPPGAVASALLLELSSRKVWQERLAQEAARVEPGDLFQDPSNALPLANRFVKEVLRKWSAPSLLNRVAREDVDHGGIKIAKGEAFQLSSYMLHHDEEYWDRPHEFDPDRWLTDPAPPAGAYVPFGWAPTSCIGAMFGIRLLTLWAYHFSRTFEILEEGGDAHIVAGPVPIVVDFRGRVRRRRTGAALSGT